MLIVFNAHYLATEENKHGQSHSQVGSGIHLMITLQKVFIHSFICLFVHKFISICLFAYSVHQFINGFVPPFLPSLIP